MIEKLKDWFLPQRHWKRYKAEYQQDNGLIEVSLAACMAAIEIFKVEDLPKRLSVDLREVYITPPIGTLYDLLIMLQNASEALEDGGYLPTINIEVNQERIRLDHWLQQPADSSWGKIEDVGSAFLILGGFFKIIDQKRGDKSLQYLERKLGRALVCFLTLVEIIGDHYGRPS